MPEPTTLASYNLIGVLGYSLSALLFTLLGAILVTGWRGRLQGGLLLFAVFASALWAGILAAQAAWHGIPIQWLWGLEAVRNLAWVLFLIRLLELRAGGPGAQEKFLRWARIAAVLVALLLALPLEDLPVAASVSLPFNLGSPRLLLNLVTAVAGLVLVEQVFRNTPWQHRWGIKFLCLGVGGLFAFDFFFFADAMLFQRLDLDIWAARGGASALTAPLIGISAARNPQWSFDLFVSRKVVFHSTALFAAGIYLLLMSLAGYYIRDYGGEWSSIFQTVFFFGAGIVLVVLLFSGRLRSRLKVLVNKHFFNYRYDYREEWLHLIDVLSGKVLAASLPERVILALSGLVDSPGGVLWVRTEGGRYEHVRAWNLAEDRVNKALDFSALADFLGRRHAVINLTELRQEPPVSDGPEGYDDLDLPEAVLADEQLWLIVPLQHDDELLGFVVLTRPRTPQAVNWEVIDMLKIAARQAASYLALDRAARALADARQFEGFNRLSAFVVHDLKNLIAQLSLVAKNAERHRQNPAFVDDAIATIRNSVDKMNRLLSQLRSPGERVASVGVDLRRVVADVVHARSMLEPVPLLELDAPTPLEVCANADRLASVISHLVQNAQEATARDGQVTVRLTQAEHQAVIEVQDTGAGMDAEFVRERLFKPFDSTKGLTGMGVGAYDAREFVLSLGGRVVVESAPGRGTVFRLLVPIDATTAPAGVAVTPG